MRGPEGKIRSQPVEAVATMFLASPMPFNDGHTTFTEGVTDIYHNADDELRNKIHEATRQAIANWSPAVSTPTNIRDLAILSSFIENKNALPDLIHVVNEHRISGNDEISKDAEACIVAAVWAFVPNPIAVEALEKWWGEEPRDWIQTRAIFLGLLEADPNKLGALFPKFVAEATKHEDREDIPLLVDMLLQFVPYEKLLKKLNDSKQLGITVDYLIQEVERYKKTED